MESAAWGLIGTLVGALASIGATWLTGRSAANLQQERNRDDRRERAAGFQRQTLLDLQEAMHDGLRLITRAHMEDRRAFRETKVWGKNLLGPELNEELRLAQRRVAVLVERVADDELRVQVKELMRGATEALNSPTEQGAKMQLESTYANGDKLLVQLGVVLRSYY